MGCYKTFLISVKIAERTGCHISNWFSQILDNNLPKLLIILDSQTRSYRHSFYQYKKRNCKYSNNRAPTYIGLFPFNPSISVTDRFRKASIVSLIKNWFAIFLCFYVYSKSIATDTALWLKEGICKRYVGDTAKCAPFMIATAKKKTYKTNKTPFNLQKEVIWLFYF